MMRTYSELIQYPDFESRLKYLQTIRNVGEDSFGFDRYLNQVFYSTKEWKQFRDKIIIRDNGCDLAHPDFPLNKYVVIHHLNPITKEDILNRDEKLLDPENVVCVSDETHRAIHYGLDISSKYTMVERRPNDTCPWR